MVTVANYIAMYLSNYGVKNVFMLSGTGSVYLDDAFANEKKMNYVCARHEAAAVMMAEASGKLTNKIGVVIATTGPGGTNAIGGVTEAWADSVPVLILSGQVYSFQISEDVRSFGIQGFNIIENVKNITKYAVQITDSKDIKYHLEKAIYLANHGRPGPVWIDIPMDVQAKKINADNLRSYFPVKAKNHWVQNRKKIDIVIEILKEAKKPTIVFGQGVRNARCVKLFKKIIDLLQIPVISARMGLDILPYSNKNYMGIGGIRGQKAPAKILEECDFVLALGTSLTHAFLGKTYNNVNKNAKLVMVNLDEMELFKPGLKIDYPIKMDIKDFLTTIEKEKKKINSLKQNKLWKEKCKRFKNLNNIVTSKMKSNPVNSYYFIDCLNQCSKNNHIFVNDAGSANYICSQALVLKANQRELTSGAFYSMGVALPLAIGASVTMPRSQIIAITGDGSIELNIQELRTMSKSKLNIKLFILNNGGYASIRKSQDEIVGGRYTDDADVLNFEKTAGAFDIKYDKISDYLLIKDQLKKIFSDKAPALIEVICDPNQDIYDAYIT